MLIAQITDPHIGPGKVSERNDARLAQVVARVNEARPDLVLATGDLTEDGDAVSYERLKGLLAPLSAPLLPVLGNHDLRDAFLSAFPEIRAIDGFAHYAVEHGGRRFVVLDTVEAGLHGGAFCETRAAWLSACLDAEPDMPTLIVLHHPPVRSGIGWMDENADGPWSKRMAAVLEARPQIVALVAGHLHRPLVTRFAGHPLIVAPASAPQVVLDLACEPRGGLAADRPRIVDEDPGFALHRWTDDGLVTHFGVARPHAVIARLDAATGRIVPA